MGSIFIGIDPGASGGIAIIGTDGDRVVSTRAFKMPETERDVLDALHGAVGPGTDSVAVIERSQAAPRMGRSSAFNYGRNYGALRMALIAAMIPFSTVPPSAWQPAVGVPKSKTPRLGSKDKNLSKRRAQELFPALTVTHAIADALLIAEYCRRMERGSHGKAESLTRTEGTYEGTGGEQIIPVSGKPQAVVIRPTGQGRGRARAAQRPDPSPQRARARRPAGDGKHGRRSEDGRHLPADREPARRDQRPSSRRRRGL